MILRLLAVLILSGVLSLAGCKGIQKCLNIKVGDGSMTIPGVGLTVHGEDITYQSYSEAYCKEQPKSPPVTGRKNL